MSKLREAFLVEAVGLVNRDIECGTYNTGSELTFYLPDIKKVVRLKLDYRPIDLIKTENGKEYWIKNKQITLEEKKFFGFTWYKYVGKIGSN